MKKKIIKPTNGKLINSDIVERFDCQGKRMDQVEFSYKMFMVPILIVASWILVYGLYKLIF